MSPNRPPPALLPVLLLLGVLGAGVPLAMATPSRAIPPLPAPPPESIPVKVEPGSATCAGLWAQGCEEGLRCVDNPADSCLPQRGDSDCPGLCVQGAPPPVDCGPREPGRRYVSHEPALCALLLFSCGAGESPFFDACGCGCERTP